MTTRRIINDYIVSALREEINFICPLMLSNNCVKFEKIESPFTNHHIDCDPSNSKYYNLIRICPECHDSINQRKEDGDLMRKIKLRKKSLTINYFGLLSINVLKMAYKYSGTSAMPSMALPLLERGYLAISNKNIMSVGSLKHVTFQDYDITAEGKELIEKLIGIPDININDFSL